MTEKESVKLDAKNMMGSLNGFEEIAISKSFKMSFEELGDTGTLAARALVFVDNKRNGMKDAENFKAVMNAPSAEIQARFAEEDDEDTGEA